MENVDYLPKIGSKIQSFNCGNSATEYC